MPSPETLSQYSHAVVSDRALERNRGSDDYVALLGNHGRVLASSRGFTPQARAGMADGRPQRARE